MPDLDGSGIPDIGYVNIASLGMTNGTGFDTVPAISSTLATSPAQDKIISVTNWTGRTKTGWAALRQIFATDKGTEGSKILEARRSWFGWGGPTEFTFDFRASVIKNDARAESLKGGRIFQDPYYRPCVLTDKGREYLDMRRVMYHELGHAIWGYDDQPYPNRMENIDKAANVFAEEFRESRRKRYAPYHQSPQ